jgi:hypothetical protein
MIRVAANDQSCPDLVNGEFSNRLSCLFNNIVLSETMNAAVAFLGYSTWRREENGDANLFDEQVFVVRDG